MNRIFHYQITENEQGTTVLDFLRKKGFSRHILSSMKADKEALTRNGQRIGGREQLLAGDHFRVRLLETVDSGRIMLDNEDITHVPAENRYVNTVFQSYALFPHMTVFENVAFGLRMQKTPAAEITPRVMEALRMVQLETFAQRKPHQLSGGQQQRVAIARAVVNKPRLLLLDESLSALDYKLRKQMQNELKALQRKLGITFVFVTHDQEEALTISDTIVVMNQGYIQQIGTPEMIYNEPVNAFVADFIGDSNIINGTMIKDKVVEILGVKIPCVD